MTKDMCATILARLASGESMMRICRDEHMPAEPTVYRHVFENEEFRKAYEEAREIQAERAVDEMLEIADDGSNDWMEKFAADGTSIGWQVNGEHVQRSRLRIDTRKWTAMKLRPKKYGDRVALDHGSQVDNPLVALVQSIQGSALPLGFQQPQAPAAQAAADQRTVITTSAAAPAPTAISPLLRPHED